MPLCNILHDKLKCKNIICSAQCIVVFKIYLMLSRCHLVVGGFDLKSHIFQIQDHISSGRFSKIQRRHIKIAGFLVCQRRRTSFLVRVE